MKKQLEIISETEARSLNQYGEKPKQYHYTDCNEENNARDFIFNLDKWHHAEL